MLVDMEELCDLGSIEMKPMGKAAFMSCCWGWLAMLGVVGGALCGLLMRFPCWAMCLKFEVLLFGDVMDL